MTPIERIIEHEQLVNLICDHGYMPQKSQQNFGALVAAMKEYAPGANYDMGCTGCIFDIAHRARVYINNHKKALEANKLTFMTFPKQEEIKPEPKKRGRKPKNP